MKPYLMATVLAMSFGAGAAPPSPTLPSAATGTPVDNPDLQAADAMAARWRHGLAPDTSRAAVRLQDSEGKVLGRLSGDDRVLLVYRKQPVAVVLGRDIDGEGNFRSGGFNWANNAAQIYYTSTDCSGPGLLIAQSFGTSLFGYTTDEQGKQFLLIADAGNAAKADLRSTLSSLDKQCFSINGFPLAVTPIIATVCVEDFAKPPFFIF